MASPRSCTAVYPGTFDPLTYGHVSLVRRGLQIFETVIVAVAEHSPKSPLFTLEERVAMAAEVFDDEPRLMVESFSGLLVDYVNKRGANVILRGLRAVSDFEYEFQMALMNRKLDRDIQTIFMMTDYQWFYVSSTIVKEVARHGGNISGLVPSTVYERMAEHYPSMNAHDPHLG